MTAVPRDLAVLAFADELDSNPALLAAWATTFDDDDEITLVIHPCGYSESEVARRIGAAACAAGIDDPDDSSPDLIALTGPLGHEEDLQLVGCCAALFSRRRPGQPFDGLRQVDELTVSKLRDLLPAGHAQRRSATERCQRQITRINNQWNIVHRGTPEDTSVIRQIFVEESYSLTRFARFPGLGECGTVSLMGERPLIIDCGANIGASSMYFSMLYPDARVVAIEPALDNFELLCENVVSFRSVRSLNTAIASECGTLLLSDPGCGAWGYRTGAELPPGRFMGEVDAISVAQVLHEESGTFPFILKVDIEGAEVDLFSRHLEAISRFPVVIIELHDWMLPGEATSKNFLHWHVSEQRDFVQNGENIFSLSSSLCRQRPRG
jgi:FkbM family methyltransferase